MKKLNQSPIVCCVGRIMRAVTENPHNFKWNTRQHQINLTVIKLKHIKTIRTGVSMAIFTGLEMLCTHRHTD